MKIKVYPAENRTVVQIVHDGGHIINSRSFYGKSEVESYLSGLQDARIICSGLVQDFPSGHETNPMVKSN